MSIQGSPIQPEIDTRFNTLEGGLGTNDVARDARIASVENGLLLPGNAANTETLSAGAVSVSKLVTLLNSTGAAVLTLAAPAADGQFKTIKMISGTADCTLAMTNFHASVDLGTASVVTFCGVGDSVMLYSVASKWLFLARGGIVGLT